MNLSPARFLSSTLGVTCGAAAMAAVLVFGAGPAQAAEAPVGLGTAGSFAVLAGSTVTNTGPSVISGDLGVHPGTAVTGFPPGTVIAGSIHASDAMASQAKDDLTIGYNDAAGRSSSANVSADLAGQTLVSGVYTGPTLGLTGTVTLDAQGDPNAVFIFQAGSTLITSTSSTVALIGGASACNVYWQVGSSATLGTNSVFVGSVMALTSISANTGATIQGRLLARNGAVTLDDNTITRPDCTGPTSSTTSSSSSSTSPTTSPTSSTTSTTSASPTSGAGPGTSSTTAGGGATSSTGQGGVLGKSLAKTGVNAADTGSGTGNLPFTGGHITGPLWVGLLALGLGTMLVVAGRRQSAARVRRAAHVRRH